MYKFLLGIAFVSVPALHVDAMHEDAKHESATHEDATHESATHENAVRAQETVLVFAPHPDDDILGCGGSIVHHVRNGDRVIIVYMTSGDRSRWKGNKEELPILREAEAKRAAKKLGVRELVFLREQDRALKADDRTVRKVVDLILDYRPTFAYTTHQVDGHRDHQATYSIVAEAARRAKNKWKIPRILCYEVWTPITHVTDIKNITDVISLKLEALAEHKTQLANFNFVGGVKALNRYRGIMMRDGDYAECFYCLKID